MGSHPHGAQRRRRPDHRPRSALALQWQHQAERKRRRHRDRRHRPRAGSAAGPPGRAQRRGAARIRLQRRRDHRVHQQRGAGTHPRYALLGDRVQIVAYDDDEGCPAVGIRLEDGVLPTGHTDVTELITGGAGELDRLRQSIESPSQLVHPPRLKAPVSPTSTLLLAGGNYADHLAETGLHPTEPVFFSKLRSAVIGPDEPIRIPTSETHTDWEAELSIIISKPAYRVPAERAHEYIFGYTMINDVSARDVMDREPLQITLCN